MPLGLVLEKFTISCLVSRNPAFPTSTEKRYIKWRIFNLAYYDFQPNFLPTKQVRLPRYTKGGQKQSTPFIIEMRHSCYYRIEIPGGQRGCQCGIWHAGFSPRWQAGGLSQFPTSFEADLGLWSASAKSPTCCQSVTLELKVCFLTQNH